jgi:tRNA-splicing ligase RtcB
MFEQIEENIFEIKKQGAMKVPARIFADKDMFEDIRREGSLKQLINVASMEGIESPALAMPDMHFGYGFPIGGVAAFPLEDAVISPGGIGYDINCGVRLMKTGLLHKYISRDLIEKACLSIFKAVPSGVGSSGALKLNRPELKKVLKKGIIWALENGYGASSDPEHIEDGGFMEDGDPSVLSERALARGLSQLGTLGAGNHFIELQYVSEIFDRRAAAVFGIEEGALLLMIHTCSRGLGYQVCDDHLRALNQKYSEKTDQLPDRQLVNAPLASGAGRAYFAAMKCAANYAWVNRQCIGAFAGAALKNIFGADCVPGLIYDISHNIGKIEAHGGRKYLVHRKGATRSFGPGIYGSPSWYSGTGQPVLIPGTMGTSSYVMKGTKRAMELSFGSTCHGAGRRMSRNKARKELHSERVKENMESKGISLIAKDFKTVSEEAPQAYKDISKIVKICHNAKLSEKVAELKPAGVIKG